MYFFKTVSVLIIFLYSLLAIGADKNSLEDNLFEAQNKSDSVKALITLSEYSRFTHPEEGLSFALEALELSLALSDTVLIVKSSNKLAILQKENSLYTNAKGTIINALSLAKKISQADLFASSQLIAGHIYSSLNEEKVAKDYYNKCLQTFLGINDSNGVSYTYSGLGIVYYDNEQYEKALDSYLNAEKFWVDVSTNLKSDLWNNIGALYVNMEDYGKAKSYYKKALFSYDPTILTSDISMVYYNLGELELLQGNLSSANKYFNESLSIGRKIESPTEVMWAFEGLYLTAKKANKYKEALVAYERFEHIKDSLEGLQNAKDVMQIETMYHQEEHLKKIKDQELKIIQAERKIDSEKFKNIIYVSFSIFIALIFVLVLFIYLRSRRLSGMLLDQRNRISESLKEKEVLLKEIHHRVKNNLQVISSLLNLQRYSSGDKGVEYIIDETQNRINAIALVHQKLYQSENVGRIDFSIYIRELVEQESVIYLNKESPIEKIYEIEENSSFDIDLAVSLGLIVSELIINAFKYAFSADRKNVLIIKLSNKSKDEFTLVIRDSGAGLPPGFENGKKESLGMELVKILAEQINGSLSYRNDNGAVFTVQFKV